MNKTVKTCAYWILVFLVFLLSDSAFSQVVWTHEHNGNWRSLDCSAHAKNFYDQNFNLTNKTISKKYMGEIICRPIDKVQSFESWYINEFGSMTTDLMWIHAIIDAHWPRSQHHPEGQAKMHLYIWMRKGVSGWPFREQKRDPVGFRAYVWRLINYWTPYWEKPHEIIIEGSNRVAMHRREFDERGPAWLNWMPATSQSGQTLENDFVSQTDVTWCNIGEGGKGCMSATEWKERQGGPVTERKPDLGEDEYGEEVEEALVPASEIHWPSKELASGSYIPNSTANDPEALERQKKLQEWRTQMRQASENYEYRKDRYDDSYRGWNQARDNYSDTHDQYEDLNYDTDLYAGDESDLFAEGKVDRRGGGMPALEIGRLRQQKMRRLTENL
jgi:hypothetical protein